MHAIDGDMLLEAWETSTKRGRLEFDQVIMCSPVVDVVPTSVIQDAIREMEAVSDAECRIGGPRSGQWAEKCIDIVSKLCLRR